jgi:RNA polymerase sigma factor (sigma-70 family)
VLRSLTAVTDPPTTAPAPGWRFDAATMDEVVTEQWVPLVHLAGLLTARAHAEDVVQDVCLATWRRGPEVSSREHLIAYLRAGVVNRCRSAGRRSAVAARYLTLVTPSPASVEHGPAADVAMLAGERRTEVLAALARLSTRQREVLVLRYWAELSEGEIAEVLGISRGTVKSTAHHAQRRLALLLGDTL